MLNLELKKYPIGKFIRPDQMDETVIRKWVKSLEELPAKVRELTQNLSEDELELQYRPGSWTIRQIVHHLPDSHMNGYIRMKLALTEDTPTIKPYDENAWATLPDIDVLDISTSLNLLDVVHQRWLGLIKYMNTAEMGRSFYHPGNKVEVSIREQIGLYAWHGEHHFAHIRSALKIESE